MVERYIAHSANIIVEVITCKDDMENQAVHTLARAVDPAGLRTVGVLTKPDTIEQGCHDLWLDVLGNRKCQLAHGYFVIKNPSKSEIDKQLTFE